MKGDELANDPRCSVGWFGGLFGSGEPMALLSFAMLISVSFVLLALKFKEHDGYNAAGSKIVEVSAKESEELAPIVPNETSLVDDEVREAEPSPAKEEP